MNEIDLKIEFILSLNKKEGRYLSKIEDETNNHRKYFLNTFGWFADIFESSINLLQDACFYFYSIYKTTNHIRLLQLLYIKESLEFFVWSYNALVTARFPSMNIFLRSGLESIFSLLWISYYHETASWVFWSISKHDKKFRFSKFLKNDLWLWDEDFWYSWKSYHAHWNSAKVAMEFHELITWEISRDADYIKVWIEWWINKNCFQMWCMFYFIRMYFLKPDIIQADLDDNQKWILYTLDVLEALLVWAKRKNPNNKYCDYMSYFKDSLKIAQEKENS